ncbi:peptide chain release factor 3 [Gemmata sp.]|uniref:peptide chain release factor 3 n=1 Tax=Gemmata sp. TaxID=1914242 RepID=UPI003F6FC59D
MRSTSDAGGDCQRGGGEEGPPGTLDPTVRDEGSRRRTFAIISHPDAGKTTLTEKFLLYAGQIDVAGAVRGRKTQRAVASDWMDLERERGISISSTALSFPYQGRVVNLLDTPGHQDFSEDTYRTLAAADSAVMVIDAAKGIETQTRKLFKVCSVRGVPILTFINKMDRLGRDPMSLLSEIEQVLGIDAVPMNWPLGLGDEFRGVYDRGRRSALLFRPAGHGSTQVPTDELDLAAALDGGPPVTAHRVRQELELLDGAGVPFDRERFLAGRMTPVFFGSAMTNFGVGPFLDAFLRLAPPPGPRKSDRGLVPPDRRAFAGQVFKIQANLNPRHRDRVAFVRVCCGRFDPEADLTLARTGGKFRIKGSHRLFAREREAMEEAYPGDIIGLTDTGGLRLGDTLCAGPTCHFEALPQFSPECFAAARCPDTGRRKQFTDGLRQLADEGVVQVFTDREAVRELILAAVGELQFDVVKFRLESEYGVRAEIAPLPYRAGAWVAASADALAVHGLVRNMKVAFDHLGRAVVLAEDPFSIRYLQKQEPGLGLLSFADNLFAPSE